MSLADARAADAFLAGYVPRPKTKAQRAKEKRDRDARTLKRMTTTIEQALTRSQSVTERDLQDFTPGELERFFTKARRAARVEVDA